MAEETTVGTEVLGNPAAEPETGVVVETTPAPETTPTLETSSSEPNEVEGDDKVDWAKMFSDSENESIKDDSALEATPTPDPGVKPLEEGGGVEEKKDESIPKGETETPEEELKEGEPPAATSQEPVDYEAQKTEAFNQLQASYKLSDQDLEKWEENSGELLPAVAARLHMNIFDSVFQTVVAQLPQLIKQIETTQGAQESFSKAFFEKWPKLVDHADLVNQYLSTYAAVKPQATQEELLNDVGVQSMVTLKLPFDGVTAPLDKKPDVVVPFKPATPGGGTFPAAGATSSPWEELLVDEG